MGSSRVTEAAIWMKGIAAASVTTEGVMDNGGNVTAMVIQLSTR